MDCVLFFRAVYEPFIVATSTLDVASKRNIRPWIVKLGGHIVSEWTRHCSLLIMNKLTITIKVSCMYMYSRKGKVFPIKYPLPVYGQWYIWKSFLRPYQSPMLIDSIQAALSSNHVF